MLVLAVAGMGLANLTSGVTSSLAVFAAMRFVYGISASAINVPIYQFIANTFPPEKRATANAIENTGYYLGCGIASFMVLIIKEYGWRAMYMTMGSTSLIISAIVALFIKNQNKQDADEEEFIIEDDETIDTQVKISEETQQPKSFLDVLVQFKNTIVELMKNPTSRWVTLGGAFRFYECFTLVYFLPAFY